MDASLFYRGATGGWSPILQELDCRRELIDDVLIDVILNSKQSRPADLVVIKAEAGAGKSVFLRRLAWCAAIEQGQLSLWVTAPNSLDDTVAEVIAPGITDRLFVFVDDLAEHGDSVMRFLSRARKLGAHLTVIGVERTNRWNTLGARLLPYVDDASEYELPRLTSREIRALLNLLSDHSSLGQLSRLTPDEQYEEFSKVADRQLLVALHEATQGKPLEEILKDEYDQLAPELAQSLYLTVCLLNRTGTPIRAGLIARVHGISFEAFRERFFGPLEHVVIATQTRSGRDIEYTARHPVIADLVFRQVLSDPEALFERIAMVLRYLNTLYASDQSSFRDLVKARTLLDLFPDQRMIDQLYDLAEDTAPSDGHVFLQRARFEMRRDSPNFARAKELVRRSEELLPGNIIVRHVYAELEYERADRATNALQREAALQEADDHLRDLYRRSSSPHAFHTKSKIELLRLRTVLQDAEAEDEERVQAIQRAENAVWSGLQQWPEDAFILESESRLARLLNEDERALRALERAAASNLRNATIVTRLVRLYRETAQVDKARELLRQASAVNPGERRYHYERARLLMDEGGDGSQIETLLRKSFAEGDSNRLVQFLHARQMYINGNEREAKARFKLLSARGFSGRNTRSAEWTWRIDGEAVACVGKVCRVNRNSGFVERHGAGEWIFVPPLGNGTNPLLEWDIGTRVRFNIGFNWRGPIAVNVEIDNA